MVYLFTALLVIGVLVALPTVIYTVLRKSDSLMGAWATNMLPSSVLVVMYCFAGAFILAGLIGLLA